MHIAVSRKTGSAIEPQRLGWRQRLDRMREQVFKAFVMDGPDEWDAHPDVLRLKEMNIK